MELNNETIITYVYTLGVLATGVFLRERFGGFEDGVLWVSLFAAAIAWIAYYQYSIAPRLKHFEKEDVTDHK